MHISVSRVVRAVAGQWKVPGSIPGMDKGIFDFWGADRPAFPENGFKTKNIFFLKIRFFFLKMKFRDINRYAQIYTDVSEYAQIQA